LANTPRSNILIGVISCDLAFIYNSNNMQDSKIYWPIGQQLWYVLSFDLVGSLPIDQLEYEPDVTPYKISLAVSVLPQK